MWYAVQRVTVGKDGEPDFWKVVNHSRDEKEMRNWVKRLQKNGWVKAGELIVVYDPTP